MEQKETENGEVYSSVQNCEYSVWMSPFWAPDLQVARTVLENLWTPALPVMFDLKSGLLHLISLTESGEKRKL